MRTASSAAAIVSIFALLGGCNVNLGLKPANEEPVVVWSGYLQEINGSLAQDSGIRLEITHTHSKLIAPPSPLISAQDA